MRDNRTHRLRPEKKAICDEIQARLVKASYVILTDFRGMKVQQAIELRKRLAKLDSQIHVVPNRLCQRVMADLQWGMADDAFIGPTALVTGRGDVIETAKLLKAFNEEHRLPAVKLGRFDGRYFSRADLDTLVQLPAKPVLFSMLVGTVAAPMSQLVGVLKQKVASLVYVLKAVQEKKGQPQ